MKQFLAACALGFAFVAATISHAAQTTPVEEIKLLKAHVDYAIGGTAIARLNNSLEEDSTARAGGLKGLEEQFPVAVRAAKGHADLTRAVKEYYLAAQALLKSSPLIEPASIVERAQATRLEETLRAKGDALDMEVVLAGLK